MPKHGPLKLFSGSSNPVLAQSICDYLGIPEGAISTQAFSDGELHVSLEENVRGADVFLIQSTCPPVHENLIELLIMIDAACRASAARVTAVMPYYGYGRQDRKDQPRVAITAKLVANLLTVAGVNRVLTIDLHAGQIQGFFDIPVDNLYAAPVLAKQIASVESDKLVIAAPDLGSVRRARWMAELLGDLPMVITDKRRPKPNEAEIMNVIGSVEGKDVILVDDLIDTAGTLCASSKALMESGAERVWACATHPVLSGKALDNLAGSRLEKIVVCNTIPLGAKQTLGKIQTCDIAPLLAEAIKRIHEESSISSLFSKLEKC